MEKPILDPSIPYIGPIYGGRFSPGKIVRIQGTAPGVAYRFSINLQCGPETVPRDDVAVQLSVRILDGFITINSLQNGIWGEEQRGESMPIKRAERFEIIFMCDFNQYKVAINGQHYCEFPQRIHYDRITHLAIDGDVSIVQITYESASAGGLGAASGSGIGSIARSAPLPVETENDDFEMIDSTTTNKPPGVGFSQPPPYTPAMNGNQGAVAQNAHSAAAPYPTGGAVYPTGGAAYPTAGVPYPAGGSPYPTGGSPYPTGGSPYPTGGSPYPTGASPYPTGGSPYPTGGVSYPVGTGAYPTGPPGMYSGPPGVAYPTGIPGAVGVSHYPPPGAPGIPPPPPGAPVPLNAVSSNFRRNKRPTWQKCCATCCGVCIAIVIIIAVIVVKVGKSVAQHNYEYKPPKYEHAYDPDYD